MNGISKKEKNIMLKKMLQKTSPKNYKVKILEITYLDLYLIRFLVEEIRN